MDFEFDDEQEMLRDSVRRYLADRAPVSPFVRSVIDTPSAVDEAVWKGLVDLGVTSLLVPEAHGGAGMGMVDAAVVLEELGRAVHPSPYRSTAIGVASMLAANDGPVAARWLPRIAAGSATATLAVLEPGRRLVWESPATRAEDDRLHGTKLHVADALFADVLLVAASDGVGTGVWAVEGDAPGLTVEPIASIDPTERVATVHFDGSPGERLAPGDLAAQVATALDRLGVASVVDAVGAASRALELSVEYASERVQFDRPIGSFQAVQHLCADMLHAVEVARVAAYYACWAADHADPEEAHRAAVMAQAWAAAELTSLGATAIQVFGGIGYTWEHDIHFFYKRMLSCGLGFGSADDHLAELAAFVLD